MNLFQLQYELECKSEKIGSIHLELNQLQDLDQAIDQVFQYLQDQGCPELLEELCPYFGVIWPSARGLSLHLDSLDKGILLKNRVLELGCGLALPSLVAARCGARVVATDCHPEVPKLLELNLRHNQIQEVDYIALNWEKEEEFIALQGQYDWIIGSDILYEKRFPQSLSHSLKHLLAPGGQVLISDPGRPYLQSFVDEMSQLGFSYETHIYSVDHTPKNTEVFVLQFKKSPSF